MSIMEQRMDDQIERGQKLKDMLDELASKIQPLLEEYFPGIDNQAGYILACYAFERQHINQEEL